MYSKSLLTICKINIGLVNTDRFMSIVLIYQSLTFKVNKTKQAKVRYILCQNQIESNLPNIGRLENDQISH